MKKTQIKYLPILFILAILGCQSDFPMKELGKLRASLGKHSSIRYFKIEDPKLISTKFYRDYIADPEKKPPLYIETLDTIEALPENILQINERVYSWEGESIKLVLEREKIEKQLDLRREIRLTNQRDYQNEPFQSFWLDTTGSKWLRQRNQLILDSILFTMEEGYYLCGTAAKEIKIKDFPQPNVREIDQRQAAKIKIEWGVK